MQPGDPTRRRSGVGRSIFPGIFLASELTPRGVGSRSAMPLVRHGRENPYHLRPVLGHKLPVQRAYQKPIVLYNPHDQLLKLKEIYTSESFLLLSFPDLPQVCIFLIFCILLSAIFAHLKG